MSIPRKVHQGSPERRERVSTRERLITAADELFYAEGVNSVGIDRVIEHAGVAKASLYRIFGSKEELVTAYLLTRHEDIAAELRDAISRAPDPRARIMAVFDTQARRLRSPVYHGCAFTRASAEPAAGAQVQQATDDYRDFTLTLFTELAAQAGAGDPKLLGMQLHALYHAAAAIGERHKRRFIAATRSAAATLIDAALLDTG
jgi:AcrR family transcriptional regulator